jgi:hypothetical protein
MFANKSVFYTIGSPGQYASALGIKWMSKICAKIGNSASIGLSVSSGSIEESENTLAAT